MLERFKAFITSQRIEEPKDWEKWVICNYNFVISEIGLADEAQKTTGEGFMKEEHAQRVKTRIANLTTVVLDTIAKQKPELFPPQYIEVESNKVNYFYLTKNTRLIPAQYEGARTHLSAGFFPSRDAKVDIDDGVWCLDKGIVTRIANGLVELFPSQSSRRILAQAA